MDRRLPGHPGESILLDCIEPLGLTVAEVADHIQVPTATLAGICRGEAPITADIAVRIDQAFGGGAETWLALQSAYDLAKARNRLLSTSIKRMEPAA